MKNTAKKNTVIKLPKAKFCAGICRICPYYDMRDTDSRGWGWCTRLGGYRSPTDYCGYNPNS